MREVVINGLKYKLEFGFNSICALEDKLGMGIGQIVSAPNFKSSMANQRTVFWAALLTNHRNIDLLRAGELLDSAGGDYIGVITAASDELAESLLRIFPQTVVEEDSETVDSKN